MDVLGKLQVMQGDEDTCFQSRAMLVIANKESGDIRIECASVNKKDDIVMFRFDPQQLMAAIVAALMEPEE